MPDADTVRCKDACFVDLRTKDLTGAVVIPSSNPNCMYLLNAPVPEVLSGLNVAVGGLADSVILNEEYDFFCPNKILAQTVRLTRQMVVSPPDGDSWNALTLPFEPSEISEEVRVYAPESDELLYINLQEETSIQPYQPYFVWLPFDPTDFQHNVTFTAHNYELPQTPTPDQVWEGYLYTVGGICRHQEMEEAWMQTERLGGFLKKDAKATIEPFSVWVKGNTIAAQGMGSVLLRKPVVTGTEEVLADPKTAAEDNAWYTLTGIRLGTAPTQPGAYIHNRKVEIVR